MSPKRAPARAALPEGELLAAVDLGSNSFHMVVARSVLGQLRIVDRIKEHVRLAPRHARHDHVEAVRAQVDGGDHVGARRQARGGTPARAAAGATAGAPARAPRASWRVTDGACTAGHGARRW